MKHEINFKLPKFLDFRGPDLTEEEKKKAKNLALVSGGVVLVTTVVYLLGVNRGLKKGVNGRSNVYVIKQ